MARTGGKKTDRGAGDPGESLRALQRQRLAQQYDLPQFIADRLVDARQALDLTKRAPNNAPSLQAHLLELYAADVAYLEGVQARPLPADVDGQLDIVRRVCGADGCGGVLDITGVDNAEAFATARILSADELRAVFGSPKPTAADVHRERGRMPEVERGECLCFPIFDEAGNGVAWRFVGCTFD